MNQKKRYIIHVEVEEVTSNFSDMKFSTKSEESEKKYQKQWLNTDDLEEEFGIKKSTQSNWRSKKKIPYSKLGGYIVYSREKINEWVESHAVI